MCFISRSVTGAHKNSHGWRDGRSGRGRCRAGVAIDDVLHIAEIPYESGALRFRYSRELSEDGTRWIRHGLFPAYHENGQLASEGLYEHGLETGTWRDYHDNGQLAAKGEYVEGKEHGVWRHWDREGREERPTRYEHGEETAG